MLTSKVREAIIDILNKKVLWINVEVDVEVIQKSAHTTIEAKRRRHAITASTELMLAVS